MLNTWKSIVEFYYKWTTIAYYGCSFVAKFSKWLLYAKKMNNRCLANYFSMFSKSFSLSANDFYMFNKRFLYSANDFYIQQEICIFNNLKFVFTNNLRFVFNEMKFIKLKPFAVSKPNLDVTKYTSKSIQQSKRSGL